MIYLSNLSKVMEEKYKIGFIHYMPFDSKNGLGKTKEELEQEGILIDIIPEPQVIEGKSPIMYVNPITKEVFYEYIDIPKSKEDMEKETFTQTLAELTIESKKKDAMIANLAETVASLTIQVNQLKGSVQ